jgi:serine/threonine protein kinase
MSLAPGTRVGAYEILTAIGAGGMGEVYRARDRKLDRDVAIKILPEALAADPERIARFEREAKTLAALNHPNIAHIHGLEESDGVRALVMELVEGPTLADRIAQGPLPLDEALPIAKQIAEALEAAHEQGIIHRDLKPAKVKVRADGTVKVLDFGLAKALDPVASSRAGVTQSPTLSLAATQAGVVLGTAAYMAPEQARGKVVDRRADIWAFGIILFEMLTGRRVFEGDDLSITLASVIKTDPDWKALSPTTPASLPHLLRRCLEKDPKRRLQAIGDARVQIEDLLSGVPEPVTLPISSAPPLWSRTLPWAVASLLFVGLGVVSFVHVREAAPPIAPEMRVDISTPPTDAPESFALSPDGQKIVFTAMSDGQSSLWLRSLDSTSIKPLRGTEGGVYPFWSPDSRSIGFFADAKLKRTDVEGGTVQVLANASVGRGGTWNRDGAILFAGRTTQPIFRVTATGGEPTPVTQVSATQSGHLFPQFLPDGRHFLFYGLGRPDSSGVYIGQLDGSDARRVLEADNAAVYASSGYLLFVRQGSLFAQRFDPVGLNVIGDPVSISEQVVMEVDPGARRSPVSASATGLIAYRRGVGVIGRQFVWVDRSGTETEKVGPSDVARSVDPALSPDARRVVLDRAVEGYPDVWVLELSRGVRTRLTSDPAVDAYPLWLRDGNSIVFASNRKGAFDLYRMPVSGHPGMEKVLLETPLSKVPMDVSLDGRFLLYLVSDPMTGGDLWALPLIGDPKPFPVVQTPDNELWGQFSPDGKWVAYQSDASGRVEVYLNPFPGPGGAVPVSTTGGAQARWRPDGKELFYVALDGRLMAVPITLAANGEVEPGAPVQLFATHIGGALQGTLRQNYMVSPDGQRFLMNTVLNEGPAAPITLILNWKGAKP